MLDELTAECSEALLQTGQELLNRSDESDDGEYKFQVVLQALVSRDQPGALELNAEALVVKRPKTRRLTSSFWKVLKTRALFLR
jgi:hypothetical protein